MRIAIVDDDHGILRRVGSLITAFCESHGIPSEIESFDTPQEFVDSLVSKRYVLVVMDVYFQDFKMTGVDAVRKLREADNQAYVIFLTISKDHMPEAFTVHAFSYILKSELETAVPRALEDLMLVIPESRTITVLHKKQQIQLRISDILSVQAEGHYVRIRLSQGEPLRVRMTFSEIMQKLEKSSFLLINKGILVNLEYIRSFENNLAYLTDGSVFPVRVRGYAGIVRQWHEYNFNKLRAEKL